MMRELAYMASSRIKREEGDAEDAWLPNAREQVLGWDRSHRPRQVSRVQAEH